MTKLSAILIGVGAVVFVAVFGLIAVFGGAALLVGDVEKEATKLETNSEEEEANTVEEIVDNLNLSSDADGHYVSELYNGEEMILFIVGDETEKELIKYDNNRSVPLTRFSELEAELEKASSYAQDISGEAIDISVQSPLEEDFVLMSAVSGTVYYDFRY